MIEKYRELYEYEKASDEKMLRMLDTVPEANRSDARFQRAVMIAGHVAAVRENWLDHMAGDSGHQVPYYDAECEFASLPGRFAALQAKWTAYLAALTDEALAGDFQFSEGGGTWAIPTDTQVMQLALHGPYHRGQIAILVEQLGGEIIDTDYVYWKLPWTE